MVDNIAVLESIYEEMLEAGFEDNEGVHMGSTFSILYGG